MLGVKFEWNANAVADVRKLILTPFKNIWKDRGT